MNAKKETWEVEYDAWKATASNADMENLIVRMEAVIIRILAYRIEEARRGSVHAKTVEVVG